jgi:Putative Ig domain
MTATEILLLYTPRQALAMMVNAENATHFPVDTFEFGTPVVVSGRETRIQMRVRESRHKLDEVPAAGIFDFTYNRLNLGEHFQNVLVGYNTTLPTSTQVLLDELKYRLGQEFFDDDVVLEEVGRSNAAPYRLRAKAESLRWVGELEVGLAEEQDLPTFFSRAILSNGPTRLGALNAAPQLRSVQLFSPYVNGTHFRHLISQLVVGNTAQDQGHLVELLNAVVAAPNQRLSNVQPWLTQPTPADFNVFNAIMPAEPAPLLTPHPVYPQLTHVVSLTLDLSYTLNLGESALTIPYRLDNYATSTFTNTPRLTRYSVKTLTDGSAHRVFLNELEEGYVFQSLSAVGGPFLINGSTPYVTDPVVPGPFNLYDAVVVYNGQPRINDIQSSDPTLNRVIVLALSELNTAYTGNLTIRYRAPIVVSTAIPAATVGQAFTHTLTATGGQAPYAFELIEGNLPNGLTYNWSTGVISGTPTAAGTFRFTVTVRDDQDIVVWYDFALTVQIGVLALDGDAPHATVDVPYDFTYSLSGGILPYSLAVTQGAIPPGLTLVPTTGRLHGIVTAANTGVYTWTVRLTDQRGITISRTDGLIVGV